VCVCVCVRLHLESVCGMVVFAGNSTDASLLVAAA
jgi:hypothetical protein